MHSMFDFYNIMGTFLAIDLSVVNFFFFFHEDPVSSY